MGRASAASSRYSRKRTDRLKFNRKLQDEQLKEEDQEIEEEEFPEEPAAPQGNDEKSIERGIEEAGEALAEAGAQGEDVQVRPMSVVFSQTQQRISKLKDRLGIREE